MTGEAATALSDVDHVVGYGPYGPGPAPGWV